MNEKITAEGSLSVKIKQGRKVIERFNEKNLVVTLGKTNLTKLLGGDVTGQSIAKIALGTSASPTTLEDNSITNAFVKNLSSISYPNAQTIQFNFDILNSEANGITIREFGLLTGSNTLFARKIRTGEIEKTDAIRIVGSWSITIN